jgi:hypothetical protein
MKHKLTIGQSLYMLDTYLMRDNKYDTSKLVLVYVKKIGRKYVTICYHKSIDIEFDLVDFIEKTQYCPRYKLFVSHQEFLDLRDLNEIKKFVRNAVNSEELPLTEWKKIKDIITSNQSSNV